MSQFSKLFVLFLVGLLAGCQLGSRPMTDTKQGAIAYHGLAEAIPEEVELSSENKAIMRRVFEEVFNQGKLDVAGEIFATDYILHVPVAGEVRSLESFKQFVSMYRTAFPDLQFTIEDQIAEGDKVVARTTVRATHKGDFHGIPATGKEVAFTNIVIFHIAGGKIVEAWEEFSLMGLMQQLGVIPPMGGEAAAEASDRVQFTQRAAADGPTTVGGGCPVCDRIVEEIWRQGKLDVADEIFAPDYVGHVAGSPDLHGPEGYKQFVSMSLTDFPDVHITIEDIIAEGDKVAGRWTLTGTHQGEFVGIPPTGVQVTVTGITIHRLFDDKVVEDWIISHTLGMLQQLGVVPPTREGGKK
jgi:steroid delta-isomerase-like uncharacterized protein